MDSRASPPPAASTFAPAGGTRGDEDDAMSVSPEALDHAVRILRRGGLVAFPTETVYGLGADARNPVALRHLYAVKGRPADHPVIVHLSARPDIDELLAPWAARLPDSARRLATGCWPGPLTLVLDRAPGVPDEVTGGQDTVGVRVPDQPLAQALLGAFGGGVAAPSANRFGRVSPTTAAHVRADLDGDVDVVLDGGPCRVGVESTIVDCTDAEPVILRLGGIVRERVEALVEAPVPVRTDGTRAAPGTRPSHYTPAATVVVVARDEVTGRAAELLARGARVGLLAPTPPPDLPSAVQVLDTPADVDELARGLYGLLRDADARQLDVLLAVAPPSEGLGAAVADRLARAATPSAGEGQ
jgi:L-threonylcarbamoyladenylate synthase